MTYPPAAVHAIANVFTAARTGQAWMDACTDAVSALENLEAGGWVHRPGEHPAEQQLAVVQGIAERFDDDWDTDLTPEGDWIWFARHRYLVELMEPEQAAWFEARRSTGTADTAAPGERSET